MTHIIRAVQKYFVIAAFALTRIQHDAAIVYAGRPFAVVILVRGWHLADRRRRT